MLCLVASQKSFEELLVLEFFYGRRLEFLVEEKLKFSLIGFKY